MFLEFFIQIHHIASLCAAELNQKSKPVPKEKRKLEYLVLIFLRQKPYASFQMVNFPPPCCKNQAQFFVYSWQRNRLSVLFRFLAGSNIRPAETLERVKKHDDAASDVFEMHKVRILVHMGNVYQKSF